ncbi:MAG: DUF3821 domain-containing protein [Methanomicrobiales archaeon]|jgi:hypothetical protein|nr:DUF3821 domain-containing protein [Methanomicrobiales archaeon]
MESISPVAAACHIPSSTDYVFVGESGLDLTRAGVRAGTEIAWWASGFSQNLPDARYNVMDSNNFFVDPAIFSGKIGFWYNLQQNEQIFNLIEPSLRLEVNEAGINHDETWIKKGNLVSFQIYTSMAEMAQRTECFGASITIEMKGPDDAIYTTLGLSGNAPFNLVDIPVYYTPYDTGVVWDTKLDDYPEGEYSFRAVATVNGLSENYPVTDMTVTEWQTFILSVADPKKKVEETPKPTPKPTPEPTREITTPEATIPITIQTTVRTPRTTVVVKKTDLPRPPGANNQKSSPPSSSSSQLVSSEADAGVPPTPEPTEPVASPLSWSLLGVLSVLSLIGFFTSRRIS